MSTLHHSIDILCPYSATFDFLRTFVSERRGQISLSASLETLGLPTKLRLERDVNVQLFERPEDIKHPHRVPDTVDVTWEPADGGPYPRFSGSIRVKPLQSRSQLVLEGAYEPPLGMPGRLFDMAVGHRIAEAAAATLLATLRSSLEAQWFAFTIAHAFAQHNANVRALSPGAPIGASSFQELSGRVTFRVDGPYLGCCIVLDGIVADSPITMSGEYAVPHDLASSLVMSLAANLKLANTESHPRH